jgi:hypothetical protein
MYHCYASGLMRIHDLTTHAIRKSDRPMTNRLVGHDSPRGCNGVHEIRQAVLVIKAAEQKAYDDQSSDISCSRELNLHSVGDV